MRIKEVEELVGISRKNIRFYEKEGLLKPGRELENSYRDYTEEEVRRLRIIKLLRKLDMPISSINDVLEERISLHEALHLQSLLLEEQRQGVVNAQRVCRLISQEGAELQSLDTERYLNEILHREENSTVLVNLRSDTASAYRETIVVSAVILGILTVLAAVLTIVLHRTAEPRIFLYIAAGVLVLLFIGVAAALIARLKEIRGGEEDDLGNY